MKFLKNKKKYSVNYWIHQASQTKIYLSIIQITIIVFKMMLNLLNYFHFHHKKFNRMKKQIIKFWNININKKNKLIIKLIIKLEIKHKKMEEY